MPKTATKHEWIKTEDRLPEPGQRVAWFRPGDRVEVRGTFKGGSIWYPDGSDMYVYYMPLQWRPLEEGKVNGG